MPDNILEINNLSMSINEKLIINNLSLTVKDKCITCLVGESGSGKSLTVASVLGLVPESAILASDSHIIFYGKSIFSIYQDAINSFNPSIRVGRQLYQMAKGYRYKSRREFDEGISEVLIRIGINNPKSTLKKYPFELSGGMLQRMMIACAIYVSPDLIIADEPTTALDVATQKEIMREFRAINHELEIAILVVTHDFGVVAELADEVIVMHKGLIVETGEVNQLFDHPREDYTKALLEASFKEATI